MQTSSRITNFSLAHQDELSVDRLLILYVYNQLSHSGNLDCYLVYCHRNTSANSRLCENSEMMN